MSKHFVKFFKQMWNMNYIKDYKSPNTKKNQLSLSFKQRYIS